MHNKAAIIRISVLALLAGALLVGGLVVSFQAVKRHLTDRLLTNYAAQEQLVGKEVSSTLGVKAEDYFEDLRLIASSPAVAANRNAGCATALSGSANVLKDQFENLARVDATGTFYCSINPAVNGVKTSAISPALVDSLPLTAPKESISGIIKSRDHPGTFVLSFNEPVYSGGVFTGYLTAAVGLDDFMNDYLKTIKFANTGFVSVMDANHTILYSHFSDNIGQNFYSPGIQALFPNHGLNDAIGSAFNGKSTIVRYARQSTNKIASVQPFPILAGTTWVVTVTVPEAEVGALFVNPVLDNAFNVMLAVSVLAVLLIVFFLAVYAVHEGELLRARDQFVSLTSHQLRTPLTAIRLFSEMLEDPEVGALNPTQKDYVGKIGQSTDRMIKLVGSILNVSRVALKRLRVSPEPTDVAQFVRDQIGEVEPLAGQKHVAIRFDSDVKATVPLDPTLFAQIVHNLLTNAVRYVPADTGEVVVGLAGGHRGLTLTVADNGIGIPARDRKKIFSQFYRAENAKRVEGEGTGLGLFLVSALARLTGLTVGFRANAPKGTVFYVVIPQKGMRAASGDKSLSLGGTNNGGGNNG